MSDKRSFTEMLNSGSEFSSDEHRRFKSLWKETSGSERMRMVGAAIDQITTFLVQEKKLQKQQIKLGKLLSLSISVQEAMNLQLTNYYSYISNLIRTNSLNARSLLNEMTEFINRIETELHKLFEEQVKVYRNLEEDDDIGDTSDCAMNESVSKAKGQVQEETRNGQPYESILINYCKKNKN